MPGKCGMTEIETDDYMVKANRSAVIRTLAKKCRGRETCNFPATTYSMGNVWQGLAYVDRYVITLNPWTLNPKPIW